MAEKVKLSKDGAQIDFIQSDSLPTSVKKFRQSPEIEGFYRFIFENDLQKEAYEILHKIIEDRKVKKALMKKEAKEAAKLEKIQATPAVEKKPKVVAAKIAVKMAVKEKAVKVVAAKPTSKKAAPAKPAKAATKTTAKAKPSKGKSAPAKKTPKKK